MSEQIYDTFTYICGECGDLVYVTKGRDTHTHESSTGEVNGGPVAHFPTDGADDAPAEPKGAVPNLAPASLVDFLLARIAEDEWAVEVARSLEDYMPPGAFDLDRVLAECEAKRRIIETHPIYRGERIQPVDTVGTDFGCELCHRLDAIHDDSLIEAVGYCDTLRALSLPFADHPDYDEAWRP